MPRDSLTTLDQSVHGDTLVPARLPQRPALVLAWSRDEHAGVGEVVVVGHDQVLGRGEARSDERRPRAVLIQQRPDRNQPGGSIESPRISRQQLELTPRGARLHVRSIGRCPLHVDGVETGEAEVEAGQTVRLGDELVFLVSLRPPVLPPLRSYPRALDFAFGTADPDGIVGESPAAWRLRDELAFAARADAHVLIDGPSGSGKELAARAVHRLSSRGERPLVARNAATFPEGLIDAELFGNVRDYPNPGTPEREGLIGRASGSTLFLDEIGEIPAHLQAHLLRVLDARGEYQRLGESRVRTADLRVVAATNRDPATLKHDFAARLTVRLTLPGLSERRDDLPLLVRHLVGALAERHDDVAGPPPLDADLVEALVRHRFTRQVRELEQILWRALADRPGRRLLLTDGVRALLASPAPDDAGSDATEPAAREPTRDEIDAAMTRCGGSVTRAARDLGLKNRFVLYRLLRKHGLSPGGDDA